MYRTHHNHEFQGAKCRQTIVFSDGGISTVGQRTRLLGTQTCDIKLVSTECLSPSPAVVKAWATI